MKKLLLFFIFFIFSVQNFGQGNFGIGATFDVNFVTGDFSDFLNTGTGFSATGEYDFSGNYAVFLQGGYASYSADMNKVGGGGYSFDFSVKSITALGGLRYYFPVPVFVELGIGGNYLKLNAEIWDAVNNETTNKSTDYEFFFAFAPSVGYRIMLAERSSFELIGTFRSASKDGTTFSSFSARAGLTVYF
ncbi:MAG: hypothetical protein GXO87_10695 [Chlorobi bacterium]|nr:hypothetical protein [Chlorobiota bacterium]